jgi:hypothetical protein
MSMLLLRLVSMALFVADHNLVACHDLASNDFCDSKGLRRETTLAKTRRSL